MNDRVQTPPTKPVEITGGETKPAPKPNAVDPAKTDEALGGMTSQGGEAEALTREGGMIGEG